MWPFQSIHSGSTVARWRSSGAERSSSIMGYGGDFMRADRSEACGCTASSARTVIDRASAQEIADDRRGLPCAGDEEQVAVVERDQAGLGDQRSEDASIDGR